jgi:hypothetical protein
MAGGIQVEFETQAPAMPNLEALQAIGTDGNVFSIIGRVRRALLQDGQGGSGTGVRGAGVWITLLRMRCWRSAWSTWRFGNGRPRGSKRAGVRPVRGASLRPRR